MAYSPIMMGTRMQLERKRSKPRFLIYFRNGISSIVQVHESLDDALTSAIDILRLVGPVKF